MPARHCQFAEYVAEILAWLDLYLGPVGATTNLPTIASLETD